MHNTSERRIIFSVATIIVCLVSVALLVFLTKYTKESLFPKNAEGYFKVVYMDGEEQYDTALMSANDTLTIQDLSKTGYTFRGWYYDKSGQLRAKSGESIGRDTKLYAFWDIKSYIVTIHPNYNSLPSYYISLDYDAAFIVTPPVRTGYAFMGWYYDQEGTQIVNLANMPAEDLTIFAKWEINKYTLRLVAGEGVASIPDASVAYNTTLTLPALHKDGYTFTGWYKERTLTTKVESGIAMPSNNLILYAGWQANSYNIVFETNGGSLVSSMAIPFEQDISNLQIPPTTRAGYNFVHWYADVDNDAVAYVPDKMPLGGLTLYAKWAVRTDIIYTIEHYFEDDNGSFAKDDSETEIMQGTTDEYRTISNRTYSGYIFDYDNIYNITEGYIAGDGSTVFKFYYKKV